MSTILQAHSVGWSSIQLSFYEGIRTTRIAGGRFDVDVGQWNAVGQQRWAISLLPNHMSWQSSPCRVLSRVLLCICAAPFWDTSNQHCLGQSVQLWQLATPVVINYFTKHSRPTKWVWFYLQQSKSEVGVMRQETLSNCSVQTPPASR